MTKQINEGLIKVPAAMMDFVLHQTAFYLFWFLRDKCGSQYPKHRAAVLAEAKKWGVKLPRTKFVPPANGFEVKPMKLDFSGLPDAYTRIEHGRQFGYLLIDFGGSRIRPTDETPAWFWDRTNKKGTKDAIIAVHIFRIRGVKHFPEAREPDEVHYMLYNMREYLEHELRHLVQHVLFATKDKRQIAMLPNYIKHGDDYYASMIERDPQIGTAVSEFIEHYQTLRKYGIKGSLRKWIGQFIGIDRPSVGNGFETSDIFKALRKRDPEAYRRAVKKFLVALNSALESRSA